MTAPIPFKKAIFWIILSLFFVSGNITLTFYALNSLKNKREKNPNNNIVAIAQKCLGEDSLKTSYLAELLNLSIDQPKNIFCFNTDEAKERLLASTLIKNAEIMAIKPSTIYIEYSLRQPIALLGDFTNTAIDKDGFLIPFKPFFTPKRIPTIFLGDCMDTYTPAGLWGKQLYGERAMLAIDIYHIVSTFICSKKLELKKIDASQAAALSFGQREVIVTLLAYFEKNNISYSQKQILRLTPNLFKQELAYYKALLPYLFEKEQAADSSKQHLMIDLRISNLAFLKTINK